MNCWHCGTELIWGGDHDLDDMLDEEYDMVTNLSCPNCGAFVEVYRANLDPVSYTHLTLPTTPYV